MSLSLLYIVHEYILLQIFLLFCGFRFQGKQSEVLMVRGFVIVVVVVAVVVVVVFRDKRTVCSHFCTHNKRQTVLKRSLHICQKVKATWTVNLYS